MRKSRQGGRKEAKTGVGIKEVSRAGNEVRKTRAWKRDPGVRWKSEGLKGKAL